MILIKMNLLCNFRCKYCYQNPIRPTEQHIDYDAVEATVRRLYAKRKSLIVLHGGEPLFQDKKIVERFFALAYELHGRSSTQTSGYLIDPDFIEMFKKYKTSIGVSIDGPYPCNELRGIGTDAQRKKQTEKILRTIDNLIENKIPTSVISVIHRSNALGERRELLKAWIKELDSKRITGRLNLCCTGNPKFDLTPEEAIDFYDDMLTFMLDNGISGWSPFRDIINSLTDGQNVVCVFRECDPYCTPAAISVLEDGSIGVCLRLYGDGKQYLRAEKQTNLRSRVLQSTDCANCKWWKYCYGGCCGLAENFDWRRKDRYCLVYKHLFERFTKMFKVLGIKDGQFGPPRQVQQRQSEFEHLDGGIRHLDSDMQGISHTDGITHLDGGTKHLDSNPSQVGQPDYSDGIRHLDGDIEHLDSDVF